MAGVGAPRPPRAALARPEIIEPENTAPSRAGITRYILPVDGPFAFYKGHDGEQCITATRRRARWWITLNNNANPRCGIPPGN